ncbi:MAG TPA: tRNA pseudouridine(38-40) synthase TruA [Eubacteriaceae bacterium]|nr:tRNA pseudouridine(38-40) synthase TruA [Eubacteriaceae bacterium]
MKRNIQLIIEYDGTRYCGWQSQKNGLSIEDTIRSAIEETTGRQVKLIGSGRTDARVHAYGQSANFMTESTIPAEKMAYAINDRLPEDICILKSKEVSEDFHSRYHAQKKEYEYRIVNRVMRSPLYRNRAWVVKYPKIQVDVMKEAAQYFVGEHDFTAFCAANTTVESKIRNIEGITLVQNGDDLRIQVKGNGFLYNMVRIMVGTLVDFGVKNRDPREMEEILAGKDRKRAGVTAPPQGLYLKKVYY